MKIDAALVRSARAKAGLSVAKAAALIYASRHAWYGWERESGKGKRAMPKGLYELFLIRTGQIG